MLYVIDKLDVDIIIICPALVWKKITNNVIKFRRNQEN